MTKFILSLVLLSLTSCATIVNGTYQRVPIASSPTGANIDVDGIYVGCTPAVVHLRRKEAHIVTLSKAGYQDTNIFLARQLSPVVLGNILLGGFIGWGVDAIDGAQYKLVPEAVQFNLCPVE